MQPAANYRRVLPLSLCGMFAALALLLCPFSAYGAGPQVTLAPSSLTFGEQAVLTTSSPQSITLTNNGPGTLNITSITVTGTNAKNFAQTNNCGASVGQGNSCQISVTFTPVTAGTFSAFVTVKDNGLNNPQKASLSGTGTWVLLTPPSLDFGSQVVGVPSQPQTVTLTNEKSTTISVTSVVIGGTNAGDFTAVSSCGRYVNPQATCTITVTFDPTAAGSRSAMVVITDSGGGGSQDVPLSGIGIPPGPYVNLSPSSLVFAGQKVGTTSPPQTVTLTNVGSALLTITGITISGINAADYSQSNNCGTSLNPGANCTISVVFTPVSRGVRTAALTIADNAPGSPQSVGLTGTSPYPAPAVNQPVVPGAAVPGGNGFSLTVNGSGFTVSSIVNWNASARPTNFMSATRLTASISASDIAVMGTATVTVSNPPPGGGASNAAFFQITNSVAGLTLNQSSLAAGVNPRSIAWGDFNGDGRIDLAVGNRDSNSVSIFLGNGDGTFTSVGSFATGQDPISLATGDFNGDGRLDLVVADRASYTISILLGNGDGSFAPHVDLPAGVEPLGVAVADLNLDGALDVLCANSADGTLSVFLGNGDGTFQPQVQYVVSASPFSVVAGDFNRDGIPDVAVTDSGANTVSVMFGNSDGTLQSSVHYDTGETPLLLATADLNNDGALDLVVVNSEDNSVSVLLNAGNGTFNGHVDYPVGSQPFAVVSADFSGDGILDLAVSNTASGNISILRGNGDGTFQASSPAGAISGPTAMVVADFDANGRLDFATANETTNSASVLLQIPLVSLSPASVGFGTVAVGSSASLPVVFTNAGSASLSISGITIAGMNGSSYSQTNTCPAILVGGASCTVNVTFTPQSMGTLIANLTFTDSAAGSPQVVVLGGVGTDPLVSLSPASLTFASQVVGTSSPAQLITLTNTGNSILTVASVTLTGANQGDFSAQNSCFSVAAGGSCSIAVTFTPLAVGQRTASVTITDDAPDSPQSVPLTGTGASAPGATLSPTSLLFSGQAVDTTSPVQTVTLTNSGGSPLSITGFSVTGDYTQTNNCAPTLPVGSFCTISVNFTPTAIGARSGTVSVTDNAGGSPQSVTLNGTGTSATLKFTPTSAIFGNQLVGSASNPKVITLTNSTSGVLTISSISMTGPNKSEFSQTNNCGNSLNQNAICTINIVFQPAATGLRYAGLSVTDSAVGSPQTVPVSGTGTLPGVTLSPASLTFPDQTVASPSPVMTVTLTNSGTAPLAISTITIGGANAADFSYTKSCGANLAAGASCSINVTFTPSATGTRAAVLSVADSAQGSPQSVPLAGTGVAPTVVLSLTKLTFTSQTVGTSSPPQSFVVTNGGSGPLTITGISLTGANPQDYSAANGCPGTLGIGASCIISVTFTPTVPGTRKAQVAVRDNASGSPQIVTVTGTGTAAAITIFPATLVFAPQPVGTSSPPQMVNVNNTGTATLYVSSIQISGANSGDFSQTNDCNSIAPGADCIIVVVFSPQAAGNRSAILSITDNAPGSPQTVSLTGTGVGNGPPTASLAPLTLSFQAQNLNTTSSAQPVTLTNTGGASLSIVSIVASGDFAQTNNCPSVIQMNSSCTMQVTFTPSANGARAGYITVSDNDPTNLQTVTLSGTGVTPSSTVTLSPRQASLTPGRTQQFIAYISGVQSNLVTWYVDGIQGGNGTVGMISASGLYQAPSAAGSHMVSAASIANPNQTAAVPVIITNYAGTFTYHNDLARSGQNLNETVLTTGNVNQSQFGKLFSYPVDGDVYAQPLYVQGVNIFGQGQYNVAYVATENDTLYAFDADGVAPSPLWKVSFINPAQGVTTLSTTDIGCSNITPVIGITGTPVIDPAANTIFLVVRTKEVMAGQTSYVQRLHAINLSSGQEQPGSPVIIAATVQGTGDGGNTVTFDPLHSNQRPGLLLLNGVIYISWGSHCDVKQFHGWLIGYDENTLQQTTAYCVTANGSEGGIWASGGAPAVDENGNIFVETGNGTFDANTGGVDYGESFLRLVPGNGSLTVGDYFTPSDWANLNDSDLDVGSGGPVILPDQSGANPHLLVGAGKDGEVFLIDRDQMGEFNPYGNLVVQALPPGTVPTFHAMPAYWNNNIYLVGVQIPLESFRLAGGVLSTSPLSQSPSPFGYPGGIPATSSNGAGNGVAWVLETSGYATANPDVLHAYDASNVSRELYNTNQNSLRDQAGAAVKFGVPTVANGKVYVATHTELDVYGLLP